MPSERFSAPFKKDAISVRVILILFLSIILFTGSVGLFRGGFISYAWAASPPSAPSYDIPLHSNVDEDIETLYNLGYLDELFIGFRPFSRMEIARLISNLREKIEQPPYKEDPSSEIARIIVERLEKDLQEELQGIETARRPESGIKEAQIQTIFLDGIFSSGGLGRGQSIKNFAGRPYENGMNLYGNATLVSYFADRMLLFLKPEFQYVERSVPNTDPLERFQIQEGYLKYHSSYTDLQIGKTPLWWGQGYGGTLLLTDNMEPLPMLRLHSVSPFTVPLPFQKRGLITYDFFVSMLEANRELPRPIFWGLRLGFKPFPSWEIGLARTAMLGGGDRPVTLDTIFRSITGAGENTPQEAGNQIAGIDTRFRGSLWRQPFVIYGEVYGEDEAGYFFSKDACLVGLHLPEILGMHRNSLRIEYADNTGVWQSKLAGVWYTHHIYSDGYTYKRRIMGDSMGSDANDLLVRWETYLSSKGKGYLSFEKNNYGVFNTVVGRMTDYSAGIDYLWDWKKEIGVRYTLQRVDNLNLISNQDSLNHEIWIGLQYKFGTAKE